MEPKDAKERRAVRPVICYPVEALPPPDLPLYASALAASRMVAQVAVPPREAASIAVPAGSFLRLTSMTWRSGSIRARRARCMAPT